MHCIAKVWNKKLALAYVLFSIFNSEAEENFET